MDDLINNVNEYSKIIKDELTEFQLESILTSKENKKIIFILGNSSCDLDSFLSCFLLSMFRNLLINTDNLSRNKLRNCKTLHIPIFNCNREDFCDRLDIYFLLKQYGIEHENLIFIDDKEIKEEFAFIKYAVEEPKEELNKETFNDPAPILKLLVNHKELISDYYTHNREIVLIDHNKLDEKLIFLRNLVTEIIDHHNDLDCNLIYKNLWKKSLFYPLGSCSTLILLENLKYIEQILLVEETKKPEVEKFFKNSFKDFMLFIPAVLIDTRNFIEIDYNIRWNNLDLLAFNKIIELNQKFYFDKENNDLNLNKMNSTGAAAKLYEDLINSKYDLEANLNLGLKKLMNKDKKEFSYNNKTVIWSSLQVALDSIIGKFGLEKLKNEVFQVLGDKSLYVFNYRHREEEGTFTFIALFVNDNKENKNDMELKSFCGNFGDYLRKELKDEVFEIKIIQNSYCLIKLNQTITRKNFEPYLNKYFK